MLTARILRRLPAAAVTLLLLPVIGAEYFRRETGREYGIGLWRKLWLLLRMVRNNTRVTSASSFLYHLLIATRVMSVPRATPGVLVECGVYKGGSAVNLSLVARLCGRTLHLFDSFSGLPHPGEEDAQHVVVSEGAVYSYQAGDYAGGFDEVRANLDRYGSVEACELHPGWFEKTLPDFEEPVVFAYLDVDLVASERTCLQHLWPLLVPGAHLFTDEAQHHDIAQLFFDREWWRSTLGEEPPGLVGAGTGLGLYLRPGGFHSSLGYTVKDPHSGALTPKRG